MSFAAVFGVLKHFSPIWFKAIAQEAEHTPATIAGLLFVWVTMAVGGAGIYVRLAEASEEREAAAQARESLRQVVAKNTTALECARQDRQIGQKYRELQNVRRLIEASDDEGEKAVLNRELDELERTTRNLEITYKRLCL